MGGWGGWGYAAGSWPLPVGQEGGTPEARSNQPENPAQAINPLKSRSLEKI